MTPPGEAKARWLRIIYGFTLGLVTLSAVGGMLLLKGSIAVARLSQAADVRDLQGEALAVAAVWKLTATNIGRRLGPSTCWYTVSALADMQSGGRVIEALMLATAVTPEPHGMAGTQCTGVADTVQAHIEEAILSGQLSASGRVNADDYARRMGVSHINAEFHVCLATCSQNAVLTEYLRDLSKRVRFYFLPVAALRRSNSLSEHRGIVDAVRRRDGGHARDLVRAHVAETHDDAARAMADSTEQNHRGLILGE